MLTEMFKHNNKKPQCEMPVIKYTKLPKCNKDDIRVIWFGHSMMLINMHGMNILTDPVMSERTSPVSFIGPKRMSALPIEKDNLPEIDVLLLSHDHYDHLDYQTIKSIDSKVKKYCVPLGVESILEGWGVENQKIISMAWYEDTIIDGLTVTSVPAQHYSSRSVNDQDITWWCGFLLKDQYHSLYYTGDTGKGKFFEDIHKKYGDVDLMMADSGQYDEMWPYVHMDMQQSLDSAEVMHAKYLIPVHWGAFALANHPWSEPAEKLTNLAENKKSNVSVIVPMIGQIVDYKNIDSIKDKWWRSVK